MAQEYAIIRKTKKQKEPTQEYEIARKIRKAKEGEEYRSAGGIRWLKDRESEGVLAGEYDGSRGVKRQKTREDLYDDEYEVKVARKTKRASEIRVQDYEIPRASRSEGIFAQEYDDEYEDYTSSDDEEQLSAERGKPLLIY